MPLPRTELNPCLASLAQQRLWFLAQLYPGSALYNEPIVIRFSEPVDESVLTRCLAEITRRHEAWRTVFFSRDGQVEQHILASVPIALPIADLRSLPEDKREAEALRLAIAEARQPFDLMKGPLFRTLLCRLADDDQRLFVTAHHMVVDGLSYFSVFLPELHALYNAFGSGKPSPLPELAIQYADFAAWQRTFLSEEVLGPQLAYLRAQLAGVPALDLPADFLRPAQPTWGGARQPVFVPKELVEALRGLSRKKGATLFTVILAAWKVLLHRYTGQEDICVGSAVSGRRRPELDPLIGYFSNNLVLRTHFDGQVPFLELLGQVKEVLEAARMNQDVPFDRLVTEVNAPRVLHQSPLYNTSCIVMPPPPVLEGAPHFTCSRYDIGTAKLDLYLELHQRPEGLCGHIEYRTDLYRAPAIARMAGHFQTLLADIAQHPEQAVGRLRLLTDAEEKELSLREGPAPKSDAAIPWQSLFEQQVKMAPDRLAAVCGSQSLTYRQLDGQANQLAHHLRRRGILPGILVGLFLERSLDMVVAVLGVLKAGGAYLPLSPSYPVERLRFVLEDSKTELVITHRGFAERLPPGMQRVRLDEDRDEIAKETAEPAESWSAPEHPAYVIYTSGSTGRPKGVLVEHRNASNLAQVLPALLKVDRHARVLWCWSFSFDCSVGDLTMTLCSGATLVIATEKEQLPGTDMLRALKEHKITHLGLPPSVLAALPSAELPLLRTLFVAGEAVPAELVARFAEGRDMINCYGPTEATVYATIGACTSSAEKPHIGRPLPNAQAFILDRAMQRVPVGIPGELYIGGSGVARGYLHRPELTAERFIPSPFSSAPGRLYRTGDLVRWRADGNIDFLGRVDRQVKLRGFRIEPDEIEAVLRQHKDIKEAAVVVREDTPGDRKLVGYVVLSEPLDSDWSPALIGWLKTLLPEYMIPEVLVKLPRLPLSPNGKLERKALPAPSPSSGMRRADLVAPRDEAERLLTAIWEEVLRRTPIGIADNFFDIGGHSLKLAAVQARILAVFQRDVSMLQLFQLPTIRELAAYLGKGMDTGGGTKTAAGAAPAELSGKDAKLAHSRERGLNQKEALSRNFRPAARRKPDHE